jgi:signal transduction histidine kinase
MTRGIDDVATLRAQVQTLEELMAAYERTFVEQEERLQELIEREAARRANELAFANNEVERLFHAVAHDLRSPLRAADTVASWIEEDLAMGELAETGTHVRTLRGRLLRLDRMLNDLLSYARVGRTENVAEDVDVAVLLEELITTVVSVPEGFAVKWADMPRLVTYRTLLSQVFQNLISNGLKHHDRNEGFVDISVREAGDRYVFRVSDDGPGIAIKHRQRIFGLFTTLRARDEIEGSGIGLACVQKVVRGLGGRVAVEGPETRGTTFKFDWPKHAGK